MSIAALWIAFWRWLGELPPPRPPEPEPPPAPKTFDRRRQPTRLR